HEGSEVDTITVTQDIESSVEKIKAFIEEYNKLIDNINGKVKEKYDRNYLPLTEEQKADMKEDDIKRWEEKAKTGLLRNDSLLQNITLAMRRALYEKVEGVNISLADIGISSKSYTDYGKLYLDEDKLRNALSTRPEEVAKLFNGVSEQVPSYDRDLSKEERDIRYNNSGVLVRISDILEDYISTKRNKDGKKGFLLEKAGIENDLSNTQNFINEQLKDYDKRINNMVEKLIKKEEQYYRQFSRLETLLTQMNQQSAWIMNQFMGNW
ncbi:MAG: flagellar filament capping protein FliD, partial [Clostridiaceae bacterium]|nr:flagellar filament capping protein FliD [Clostridiaceae bacterium]